MSIVLPTGLPSVTTSALNLPAHTGELVKPARTNPAHTNPALMNFDRYGFAVTQEPLLRRAAPWVASICGGLLIGLVLTQVLTASQPATPPSASAVVVAQ